MSSLRAHRLLACLLLILLTGWLAKWWRARVPIEDIPIEQSEWTGTDDAREAVLPRE